MSVRSHPLFEEMRHAPSGVVSRHHTPPPEAPPLTGGVRASIPSVDRSPPLAIWVQNGTAEASVGHAREPPMNTSRRGALATLLLWAGAAAAQPLPVRALDDASYVAMIGAGPCTIDSIRAEPDRKFKGAASPNVLPTNGEDPNEELVAYVRGFKDLSFERPVPSGPTGIAYGSSDGRQPRDCAYPLYSSTSE